MRLVPSSLGAAFVDAKGRTRQHFSPDDFFFWIRTNKTPLATLDSLSLLARLQRVINTVQLRAQHLTTLIKYNSSEDKVLLRLSKARLRCEKVGASASASKTKNL